MKMNENNNCVVGLCVYNNERGLPSVLSNILKISNSKLFDKITIVAFYDTSSDKSYSILESFKNRHSNGPTSTQIETIIISNKTKEFRYNCTLHNGTMTDEFLLTMPDLEVLDLECSECSYYCSNLEITDDSIQHLVHLKKLNCSNCPYITDASIQNLGCLTELKCWSCPNISDASIQHLVNLAKLDCSYCPKITDASIQHLVNLTKLY